MAKLTGEIVYGLENKEKLNRIIDALSIKPVKWDDLSLEFFDEVNEIGEDQLLGHTDKHFYRAKTEKMSHLINDIKNNDKCSFVTPISGVVKEGLIPEKISTLLKYQADFKAINEVISSQILNLFGLPTCYNFLVETNNKYDTYVGSVDMLGGNERFFTLNDFWSGLYMCVDNFIDDDYIYETLKSDNSFTEQYGIPLNFDENKLREQIISTYLVRECLLGDGDFTSGNCGFLVDTVTGDTRFVNFDFEMALMVTNSMDNVIKRILNSVYDNAPSVYDDFVKQVRQLYRVLVEVEINCVNNDHSIALEKLESNIKNILNFDRNMNPASYSGGYLL